MKKRLISIAYILSIGTHTIAMNNKQTQPLTNTFSSKKLSPFRKLCYPLQFAHFINTQLKTIKYYGGKRYNHPQNESYVYEEIIDLRTKAPIAGETFYDLIKEREKECEPYFLAAILVDENSEDKKTKTVIHKLARHYHDAALLIEWMFESSFKRILSRKDPITGQTILTPIHFFRVESVRGNIKYFASENDIQNSHIAQYIYALMMCRTESPKALCKLASYYHYGTYTNQDLEKAKKYYKKSQENIGSINNLGDVYLDQKKYNKAEKQFLLGTTKANVNAQLNLVYLFIIGKSKSTNDECLARFLSAQNNLGLMQKYVQQYKDRWFVITSYMEENNIETFNTNHDNILNDLNSPFELPSNSNNEGLEQNVQTHTNLEQNNNEISTSPMHAYMQELETGTIYSNNSL